MSAARVSVAVPLYRPSARYLAEMVESIAAQTVEASEVVFRDDSDPARRALVERLCTAVPFRYLHNPCRLGMVANWNAVVEATTGTHVLMLHQDDALQPRALEVMGAAFAEHPGLAICGVGEIRVDERSRPRSVRTRPNHRSRVFVTPGTHLLDYSELAYLMLRNGNVFGTPSALMFSRDHFDEVGGFDATLHQSVDIDFVLRMARAGQALYITEPLVRYRYHEHQATQDNIAQGLNLGDRARLYERHVGPASLSPRQVDRIRANLVVRATYDGLRAARHARWSVARQAAAQVRTLHPTPRALAERVVELLRWENADAR